jgi:nicotinamidase/pyrazinamidase
MKFDKALLIIDLQNDFCPGGALAVPEGDSIIDTINSYIEYFHQRKLPIFASRDWHPVRTTHFKEFGGAWPAHCVQNTKGAEFHPQLKLPTDAILLYKGMDPAKDSYSVFQAEDAHGVGFELLLHDAGIAELFVCGLATDYCVKSSVLDALQRKIKVRLLVDAIRGVNIQADDSERALEEMLKQGAKKLTLKEL